MFWLCPYTCLVYRKIKNQVHAFNAVMHSHFSLNLSVQLIIIKSISFVNSSVVFNYALKRTNIER